LVEEQKERTGLKRDESSFFFMVFFGLILPLYEIITLLSVVATTVDPLFPNLNTIISLMAPSIIAILFAFMIYIDLSDKPIIMYILIAVFIGIGAFLPTLFMHPIIGYVDGTNLWGLVDLNIAIYFVSVLLVVYRLYRNPILMASK
jgi:chromate transport protein ChrA